MGVIPNGASGYTPQTQGFAINGSGGENLRLEQRDEASVRTNLEGTKGAQNASGFNLFGGAIGTLIGGMWTAWTNGPSVGDPAEPGYVIAEIKDMLIAGWNVSAKINSGTWEKPANLNAITVIAIGGGRTGAAGSNDLAGPGGLGGAGGGYIAQALDPASIPSTVNYVVGQADQATSFGEFLVVDGGEGGIATEFGFTPTNSAPGRGGDGGAGSAGAQYSGEPGKPGQSTALATGGNGGAGASGNGNGFHGEAGGSVSAATLTKCGGAGGGGGGGGGTAPAGGTRTGGTGGPGGYPGGGSGGGGGRGHQAMFGTSQPGGTNVAAPGILFIFTK